MQQWIEQMLSFPFIFDKQSRFYQRASVWENLSSTNVSVIIAAADFRLEMQTK